MSRADNIIEDFIQEYQNGKEKYVLLSSWRPELSRQMAYPLIARDGEQLYATFFISLSSAKNYIQKFSCEKINDYDPIGVLPSNPVCFATHLLGLRRRGVLYVTIVTDIPDTVRTTVDDILQEFDIELTSSMNLSRIWLEQIYQKS